MPEVIDLIFYNESDLKETPKIVLFQKHLIGGAQGDPVAWKVLKNLARGYRHPFQFDLNPQMRVKGSSGTQIGGLIDLEYSKSYVTQTDTEGDKVTQDLLTVPLVNQFKKDTISAEIFRGGRLLAVTRSIKPEESVIFQFNQVLWVGIANNETEGEILSEVAQTKIHTGLNLEGVNTAEIVMTGGGTKPLSFSLRNVT